MVTAEIPECSEEFRYKWRESDTRDGKESNLVPISREYLKDHRFMVIYSALLGQNLIRKSIILLTLNCILCAFKGCCPKKYTVFPG